MVNPGDTTKGKAVIKLGHEKGADGTRLNKRSIKSKAEKLTRTQVFGPLDIRL
jgi:hypothetical protein